MVDSGSRHGRNALRAVHQARHTELRRRAGVGTSAGVFAGLVMTVWKMAEAWVTGAGLWRPPNLISTIVLGPSANTGTFAAVPFVVGMTLHLAASIAMGLAYAAATTVVREMRPAIEVLAILAYALLSWAVYQYLIMPWLAPTMDANVSPVSLGVAHVVFGAAFALWWIPSTSRRR